MKIKIFIPLFLLFTTLGYSQVGYIETDTSSIVGEIIVDRGAVINSKNCTIIKNDIIITYPPDSIKAYGLQNGFRYISRTIFIGDSAKQVFLEELVKGDISLYYYKSKKGARFFITHSDSVLKEIRAKNKTRKIDFDYLLLDQMKNCQELTQYHHLVIFNKNYLSKFIDRYNHCEKRPFPSFKWGLTVGYGIYKLKNTSTEEVISLLKMNPYGAFNVGGFVDKPILVSDFSLHVELLYSKQAYSAAYQIDNKDIDFNVNISSINFPILFRYRLPKTNLRPFINMGALINFNVRRDSQLNWVTDGFDEFGYFIEINYSETPYIAKKQIGFVIGGGLEYNLSSKLSVYSELRYNKLFSSQKNAMQEQYMNINFGFLF